MARRGNQFHTKHEAQNKRKHSWLCLSCDAVYTEKQARGMCACGNKTLHYFPSKEELKRFYALRFELQCGAISDLELQPAYPVVINGKKVVTYRADFKYTRHGQPVIEDVKGTTNEKYLDDVFKLKKKLVEAVHGITINIVRG